MMKKTILIFVGIFIVSVFTLSSVLAFSGSGDGSSGNPYQITNCIQLQEINNDLTSNYILVNNINCSNTINWNGGSGFQQIGTSISSRFTGSLNGQGYIISSLYINRGSENYVGLFGYSFGVISNINLINVNIVGGNDVGGLVGIIGTGTGTISNCSVSGNVQGVQFVGGLLGVGTGIINNSYSTANVTGNTYVGGLAGDTSQLIEYSYSTGKVSGSSTFGGLAGRISGGTCTSSFWDINTSGQSTSACGTGETTDEMKNIATYTNWDFVNIWRINANFNNGYPSLKAFLLDSDKDGVPDSQDKCPNTIGEQIVYGCSCEQILAFKPGNNIGELKNGCSNGTIDVFTKQIGWAKGLF